MLVNRIGIYFFKLSLYIQLEDGEFNDDDDLDPANWHFDGLNSNEKI